MFAVGLLCGLAAAYLLLLRTTRAEAPTIEHEEQTQDTPIRPDLAVADELYQKWLKERTRQKLAPTGQFNPCSCVSYARWKSGINVGPIGKAKNHPVNSQVPVVGAIVVTYESSAGHLAVVTATDGQFIKIDEFNYIPCKQSLRTVSVDSKVIKGYWNP